MPEARRRAPARADDDSFSLPLPALAAAATEAGCTPTELRACVRHLIVCVVVWWWCAGGGLSKRCLLKLTPSSPPPPHSTSGYAPCLGATNILVDAGAFGPAPPPPGKVGGPPGHAFACVYGRAAPAVATRVHAADPVLAAWIAAHLYGDIYSSPGLPLATKQLLTVTGLADADMPTQLYGHAVAALRCGVAPPALRHAVEAAFRACRGGVDAAREGAYARALAALADASARHAVAVAEGRATPPP